MAPSFESLVDLFERSCDTYASRPLYGIKREGTWTWVRYGEVRDMVARCRSGLAALGVTSSDRVAIVANNGVEWAVIAFATYGLGATVVPLYLEQRPSEWRFIVEDSGAKVVLAGNAASFAYFQGVAPKLPALRHVIGIDLPREDKSSYLALLEAGRDRPVPPTRPDPAAVANIVYTSGTTGKPKGVVLSHGNIVSNVNAVHRIFPLDPEDRSLSFLPWAHSYGQLGEVYTMLSMGCSVAINDALPNLVKNLAEVKPTILFAVPRVFNDIYGAVQEQLASQSAFVRGLVGAAVRSATRRGRGEHIGPLESLVLALVDRLVFAKVRAKLGGRLKYAVSASAALSLGVAQLIDAMGITVFEGYGLSETSPLVSGNYFGHRKLGSVGKPIPGVRVEIVKHDDEQDGEVVVYGPNVMQSYYHRPEEDARARLPDGGLRTGDLGYLDEDGYLFITGRMKEQFKLANGKYVQPAVLEEELKLAPHIANALVYGDNAPYCVALVVPDAAKVASWADEHGFHILSPETDERVRSLIANEIAAASMSFRGFERVKAFAIIPESFGIENGLLTPTLKVKRREVVAKYRSLLNALYPSPAQAVAQPS